MGRRRFEVSRGDGDVQAGPPGLEPGTADDAALGAPAAVLSLALRGRFCLHASAVQGPRGVLAFVGRSGKGKSTLAAHLAASPRGPWDLVADDILPVEFFRDPPVVQQGSVPGVSVVDGERLPLAAIYVLRNWRRDEVSIADVSRAEAFVTLVRHTVASRLFDASLKTSHFDACVSGSSRIPVRILCYPRRLSVLDEVRRRLEADAGSLAPGA